MAKEIERKFLVMNSKYKELATDSCDMAQGYLSTDIDATVRVRISGDGALITVKSRNRGAVRDEWEYAIPVDDARQMLAICKGNVIEKTRYYVPEGELTWEIDEFHGVHSGLVVAEIELPDADYPVTFPSFVGKEVTGDPRYYNSTLSK